MIRRYVLGRRPTARWSTDLDCDVPEFVGTTVHEMEPEMRPTGLLDADGDPIMVLEEMGPIGFQRLSERG